MLTKLISASAGTGKTYNIVMELAKLLDSGIEASQIVLITFTKDAAKELEDRVSNNKHNTDRLFIGTIDSFFGKIFKENAIQLKLSTTYKILNKSMASIILSDMALDLIKEKSIDPEYKILFEIYNVKEIKDAIVSLQNKEEFLKSKNYTIEELLFAELDFVDALREEIENFDSYLKTFSVDDTDSILNKLYDFTKLFKNLEATVDIIKGKSIKSDLYRVDTSKLSLRGGSKKYGEQLKEIKEQLKKIQNILSFHYVKDEKSQRELIAQFQKLAELKYLIYKLYKELNLRFTEFKHNENLMDFKDIEYALNKILTDPELVKKYKKRYKYILIDEFQDTNLAQKTILEKLTENLIMVGDAKQSIYRFRRADVSVFLDVERNIKDLLHLTTSYRSSISVVDAINKIFELVFSSGKIKYSPLEYTDNRPHNNGEQGESAVYLVKNYESFTLNVLEQIQEKLKTGKHYKDFAILLQTRNNLKTITKILKQKNIPYAISGRTSRTNSANRLLAIIDAIEDPNNDFAVFNLIKLPVFFIEDKFLLSRKTAKTEESLIEYLKKEELCHPLCLFLDTAKDILKTHNFMDFINFILKETKFVESMDILYPDESNNLDTAILRLAIDAKEEESKYISALELFKKSLEAGALDDTPAKTSQDAITIMTVHGSKGLEFDTVFIPCPSRAKGQTNNTDILFVSKDSKYINFSMKMPKRLDFEPPFYKKLKEEEKEAELEELKRLFYVASTRARNNLFLYIVHNSNDDSNPTKGIHLKSWAGFIKDLDYKNYTKRQVSLKYKVLKDLKIERTGNTATIKRIELISKQKNKQDKKLYTVSQLMQTKSTTRHPNNKYSGEFIHSLLEYVDDGIIAPQIEDFVKSELGKEVFSSRGINEYPFILELKDIIVKGRIDRFIVDNNKKIVKIYDYKTLTVSEIELNEQAYKTQLKYYKDFLESIYPHYKIQAKVLSILDKKVAIEI